MGGLPATHYSMIDRLSKRDPKAWAEFVSVYGPLIYREARRCGLREEDAADLTQDVHLKLARGPRLAGYQPSRGKFRTWLGTLVRNQAIDWFRRRKPAAGAGEDAFAELSGREPDPADLSHWDDDFRLHLLRQAAADVRETVQSQTWDAFRIVMLEGRRNIDAVRELGMTPPAVSLAVARVVAKIKQRVAQLHPDEDL